MAGPETVLVRACMVGMVDMVDMVEMVGLAADTAAIMGTAAMTSNSTGTPLKLRLASKTGMGTVPTTSFHIRTRVLHGPTRDTVIPERGQPRAITATAAITLHRGRSAEQGWQTA